MNRLTATTELQCAVKDPYHYDYLHEHGFLFSYVRVLLTEEHTVFLHNNNLSVEDLFSGRYDLKLQDTIFEIFRHVNSIVGKLFTVVE